MQKELIAWYHSNKRDLPFRGTKDPYKVWLAEIIFQQTRIEQGLAYYMRFIEKYPRVDDLAIASEDEVLLMWQGLGYYSRARNLLSTAQHIVNHYKSNFPWEYSSLLKLKGVGEYTAAAIASVCFNVAEPAIDGNVYRVLARLFCVADATDTSKGKKVFRELAKKLIDKDNPGDFNQAMMEIGALVCKPKSPNCNKCPLSKNCRAFEENSQFMFPVKKNRINSTKRYMYVFILKDTNHTYIIKRGKFDIWAGLYQFPINELPKDMADSVTISEAKLEIPGFKGEFTIQKISQAVKHVLSHQTLYVRFVHVSVNKLSEIPGDMLKIKISALSEYPMPRLITKYLESSGGFTA